MPSLPPNQQRQSTEGSLYLYLVTCYNITFWTFWGFLRSKRYECQLRCLCKLGLTILGDSKHRKVDELPRDRPGCLMSWQISSSTSSSIISQYIFPAHMIVEHSEVCVSNGAGWELPGGWGVRPPVHCANPPLIFFPLNYLGVGGFDPQFIVPTPH